jgi:hypothetical protein
MNDDYAPFPTIELEELAAEYERLSDGMRIGRRWKDSLTRKAEMLRNAVKCHEALRERCLISEMQHGREKAS